MKFWKFASFARIPISTKNSIAGYLFILPFLLGFVWFFMKPIIESLIYSFSSFQNTATGFKTSWIGWSNYQYIFLKDATFAPELLQTVLKILLDFPLILIISFLAASLLNQKFKGRAFARAVFFLPVIITSGVLLNFEQNSMILLTKSAVDPNLIADAGGGNFFSYNLYNFLTSSKLDMTLVDYVLEAVNEIYTLITLSGVQILIFLSALQTIPPSLKEAAHIDGATGWEFFWKITFPMVSPFIVVNLVYTIVDSFTRPTNKIIITINKNMFEKANFGISSAMGWSYFVVILVLMGIVTAIMSRGVHYEN
ncbi:carbohydrate ABC transporter permease [Paenibacillus sp. BC26]|uniref:carbohydrate ABC transporter permease n=1 Tax=Paenibacillus sp. BC26 TaxID=1881032 RepID=UPI0008DF67DB|nr:sugar ABC transporter permease [Paenibacillus sp. BC26]SFS74026.1 ABC-type sugar transport system, permease component [Paenibacillus sp. BC26]